MKGIRTRRWNDPRQPGDGLRVLVCRYRPRALPKADETWDVWRKELGPSPELHAAVHGKEKKAITFAAFRPRYLAEMARRPEAQAAIAELAAQVATGKAMTLLCSSACVDEAACHRLLLRDLVLAALAEPARGPGGGAKRASSRAARGR